MGLGSRGLGFRGLGFRDLACFRRDVCGDVALLRKQVLNELALVSVWEFEDVAVTPGIQEFMRSLQEGARNLQPVIPELSGGSVVPFPRKENG